MYPKISDFINDVFGTNIVLPIQSFGFFVALAFLAGFAYVGKEYARILSAGMLSVRKGIQVSGPMAISEVVLNTALFAFLGAKLGLLVSDYRHFASVPQEMLSPFWRGNIWGALALGGMALALKGYEFWQKKDLPIIQKEVNLSLPDDSGVMFTMAFVFGILGAKLFHALEYWDEFMKDPIGMMSSFDGLTFYGGLVCAAAAIIVYVHKKGYDILTVADATVPSLMLAYGIGRMGCHISGDGDWGIPNPHPNPGLPAWAWAYRYPHNVVQDGVEIPGCVGEYCTQLAEGVYPTSLYECLMCLSLFGILFLLRKRLPFIGQLTGIYLIFNGIERFLIEKIRVNSEYDWGFIKPTQAEIISSVFILMGIAIFILSSYTWKKRNISNMRS
jgi:prolipoprotein diacylglyceryl transferase